MTRLFLFFFVVIVVMGVYPAYSFQMTEDSKVPKFSQSLEETIRSKFGECPVYSRDACGGMLRFICDRDRQGHITVRRTGYYTPRE